MTRGVILAAVTAVSLGCGAAADNRQAAAPPAAAQTAEPAAAARPPATPPLPVAADTFANPTAAVTALVQAVTDSNSAEFSQAQSWLLAQQAEAIPAVGPLARDTTAPLFARTAACKLLAQLGPEAVEPLLEAAQDAEPRVRQVAIEQLGNVRPASQQVIGHLMELTQAADDEIRLSAITGLRNVDPPATDSADIMLSILNNTSESDSLRSAAKECLKKVNPRKTFAD